MNLTCSISKTSTSVHLKLPHFPLLLPYRLLIVLLSPGDTEKIRQLEETIRGLTKDLHSMQTTIHGINQRLYVNVAFKSSSK